MMGSVVNCPHLQKSRDNGGASTILVIGGGQAGLAVAKCVQDALSELESSASRVGWRVLVLDDQRQPGAAWQHFWDSLVLFSPPEYSSLPGSFTFAKYLESQNKSSSNLRKGIWGEIGGLRTYYPSREEVIGYFSQYELEEQLSVYRPVRVQDVSFLSFPEDVDEAGDGYFQVGISTPPSSSVWSNFSGCEECSVLRAAYVVNCSGSFSNPFLPTMSGKGVFKGIEVSVAGTIYLFP
tara:strand:- start:1280 stop:1990 length:711 start_codon:yes stop_codon:yes gene_type:complete